MSKFLWAFIFMFAAPAMAKTTPEVIDKVVAVVNDAVITQSQLDERMQTLKKSIPSGVAVPSDAVLRKQVLDEQINVVMQLQIANNTNIKATDEQVNEVIADIAKRNNLTLAQLKDKIKEEGVDYHYYEREIHDELIIHKLQQQELVPLIQVSDQEVRDYIQHEPPKVVPASSYHVVDYFIALPENPSAAEMSQAQRSAQNVVTFLKLGKAVVDDDTVKVMDFGWKKSEEMPDLFQSVVVKLNVNDVSDPVRAPNGLHVLKVLAVKGGRPNFVQETHLRKILLKEDALNDAAHVKNRLVQLRAQIAAGGDFAAIAKSVSQDPESSIDGGEMGWLKPGTYDPDIEAATRNLKVGEISQPTKTTPGWVLVQVEGRRDIANKQSLREVEAREAIFQRKLNEKLKNWLLQARSQVHIEIKP